MCASTICDILTHALSNTEKLALILNQVPRDSFLSSHPPSMLGGIRLSHDSADMRDECPFFFLAGTPQKMFFLINGSGPFLEKKRERERKKEKKKKRKWYCTVWVNIKQLRWDQWCPNPLNTCITLSSCIMLKYVKLSRK